MFMTLSPEDILNRRKITLLQNVINAVSRKLDLEILINKLTEETLDSSFLKGIFATAVADYGRNPHTDLMDWLKNIIAIFELQILNKKSYAKEQFLEIVDKWHMEQIKIFNIYAVPLDIVNQMKNSTGDSKPSFGKEDSCRNVVENLLGCDVTTLKSHINSKEREFKQESTAAQYGDLVIYRTGNNITHYAIFVGKLPDNTPVALSKFSRSNETLYFHPIITVYDHYGPPAILSAASLGLKPLDDHEFHTKIKNLFSETYSLAYVANRDSGVIFPTNSLAEELDSKTTVTKCAAPTLFVERALAKAACQHIWLARSYHNQSARKQKYPFFRKEKLLPPEQSSVSNSSSASSTETAASNNSVTSLSNCKH